MAHDKFCRLFFKAFLVMTLNSPETFVASSLYRGQRTDEGSLQPGTMLPHLLANGQDQTLWMSFRRLGVLEAIRYNLQASTEPFATALGCPGMTLVFSRPSFLRQNTELLQNTARKLGHRKPVPEIENVITTVIATLVGTRGILHFINFYD